MNEKVIEIKNLTYHYPNQTKLILKKVNLSINRGDWVSLIGANGSGKSTPLSCMAKQMKFDGKLKCKKKRRNN